jgi:excinuclease ABC subunit C
MKSLALKSKTSKLSPNPGVYVFKDKSGEIIYIGKATNLRSRVGSYFSGKSGTERPIETAIHQVSSIETIKTDSVLEALILESNLIRKHQPKYNAMGKDDKSFSYFVVTQEKFPRIIILRATDLWDKFPISKSQFPKKIQILKSKNKSIQIAKTFGPYTSKKQMEIALKIIRKIFPFHSLAQKTEKGCLDFQLGRCPGPYAGAISPEDYRKNIRGIRMILEGKKKNLVKKIEREMKEYSNRHDFERAKELRDKIFALRHIRDVALISRDDNFQFPIYNFQSNSKSQILGLKAIRVEAYDISNISGQYATGSMVVFNNGEPNKSQYRKFRIKTVQGADDVGMMREVLLRRFKNDWPQPDLIFLDGGKGHLNMAENLLIELGMKIPLVAVAKGPGRKNIKIQMPNFKSISNAKISNEINKILDDKNLVKRIMDEAHRFAIGYHKKLRRRNLLS